jgi:hypothetical protein
MCVHNDAGPQLYRKQRAQPPLLPGWSSVALELALARRRAESRRLIGNAGDPLRRRRRLSRRIQRCAERSPQVRGLGAAATRAPDAVLTCSARVPRNQRTMPPSARFSFVDRGTDEPGSRPTRWPACAGLCHLSDSSLDRDQRLAAQRTAPVQAAAHSLPTGTVTFLLTDVEGSTRLWEEHPDAMRVALARHDDLIVAAAVRAQRAERAGSPTCADAWKACT